MFFFSLKIILPFSLAINGYTYTVFSLGCEDLENMHRSIYTLCIQNYKY